MILNFWDPPPKYQKSSEMKEGLETWIMKSKCFLKSRSKSNIFYMDVPISPFSLTLQLFLENLLEQHTGGKDNRQNPVHVTPPPKIKK